MNGAAPSPFFLMSRSEQRGVYCEWGSESCDLTQPIRSFVLFSDKWGLQHKPYFTVVLVSTRGAVNGPITADQEKKLIWYF